MSTKLLNDAQPQISGQDGAERRISLSTTAPTGNDRVSVPEESKGDVTPGKGNGSNILMDSPSILEKLQTYLPTGTWVMYTALQTWAFSLRPADPPISATSNCNSHQRIALAIVLCLSAAFAFLSSFVKRFVYDSNNVYVLYPSPDVFTVADRFEDPITGTIFPCRTKDHRYCWPLVNEFGELRYDDQGGRGLRVLVFKPGVEIHVRTELWFKRMWDLWFNPEEKVAEAPELNLSILPSTLEPRWSHIFVCSSGSKAYLDLSSSVWAHALVSVLAFFTLALFSTQVTGCIYPSIPDYLSPTVQTGMLILLSLIAALFIGDDAVSLGQGTPQPVPIRSYKEEKEVPAHLREVSSGVVWIGRDTKEK